MACVGMQSKTFCSFCHKFGFFLVIYSESTNRTINISVLNGGMVMQHVKASIKFIEKCYKLYEQKMYRVALSILRDSGLAEDAVQEAFMKLMKSDVYFEDVKSDDCKRYMITVIKHASINIYNKKMRESEVIYLSDKATDFENGTVRQAGFADDGSDDHDRAELMEMIRKLPEKYHKVTVCMAVEELSVKDTARKLGITEANVRKRYERAKVMLRGMVKDRDFFQSNLQSI